MLKKSGELYNKSFTLIMDGGIFLETCFVKNIMIVPEPDE